MNDLNNTNLTATQQAQNEAVQKAFNSQQNKPIVNLPVKVDNTVTSANVQPSQLVSLPSAPQPVQATVAPSAADSFINQLNLNEQTNSQKAQESIIGKKLEALAGLTGESAAMSQELDNAGYTTKKAELNSINSAYLQKQAELNQSDLALAQGLQNIEDKPIALEFITGQQASVQRNAQLARAFKVSELNMLNARAQAVQGDIQLAKETAQLAVDTKYAPYKEMIRQYDATLEAIAPILSREEKVLAQKQSIKSQFALKEIEQKQANDNAIQSTIMEAISAGAPKSLVDQASQAKTSLQAASILAGYSKASLQNELLRQQINTEKAQRSQVNANINKINREAALLNAPVSINGQNTTLSQALSSGKITEGTRTKIADSLGVIESLTAFAQKNSSGDISGVNPLAGFAFDKLSSAKSVANRADLGAIELKVQQWASGASLTEEQTKKVNALVPRPTDTDSVAVTKTQNLVDFMEGQIRASLKANNIEYNPPKAQLFTKESTSKNEGGDIGEFENTLNQVNKGVQSASSYVNQFNLNNK